MASSAWELIKGRALPRHSPQIDRDALAITYPARWVVPAQVSIASGRPTGSSSPNRIR